MTLLYDIIRERSTDGYLVGGMVRNMLLSYPRGLDYDVAVDGDAGIVSRTLAARLGGSVFPLDRESGLYRVVKRGDGRCITVDIAPYRGGSIDADLNARDFTVNAMAVPLNAFWGEQPVLYDPLGGERDCIRRVLRPVSEGICDDDPLRGLRAVRLSAQYGLTMDDDLKTLIREKAPLLGRVAMERVRDELFTILLCKESCRSIQLLNELGILPSILPEMKGWNTLVVGDGFPFSHYASNGGGPEKGCTLFHHALDTVREADLLLEGIKNAVPDHAALVREHFDERIGGVSRRSLLLLAALLHDAGKPHCMWVDERRVRFFGHDRLGGEMAQKAGRRLRLSRRATAMLARVVANHHRVFNLASLERRTFRSRLRFFRSMGGGEGIDLLLLALADARATRGGDDPALLSVVREMVAFYYNTYTVEESEPLLTGSDVLKLFHLPEGAIIGRVLDEVVRAEEEGIVRNRDEAVRHIREWLSLEGADR
ncbi:MAG: HD domain-containing protein [Thermodesulfobacteriota bacterium]